VAELLARRTRLPVKQAEEGDRLRSGHVFISPPDQHLIVNPNDTLCRTGRVRHARPAGDVLLTSMAVGCREQAIAVVLIGVDDDRAVGVKLVKAVGSSTVAQDETSSQLFSMSRAAIATGAMDHVVPLVRNRTIPNQTYQPIGPGSIRQGLPKERHEGSCNGMACEGNRAGPRTGTKRSVASGRSRRRRAVAHEETKRAGVGRTVKLRGNSAT
jgi:two-component system chemotaxis response regulator CheB